METQHIEYKQKWNDSYLRVICGFANSDNHGQLFIGIADNGTVIGLSGVKELAEIIPVKIRNKLGIICNVAVIKKNRKNVIKIEIEPSSVPISYNGRYYLRSGSNTFELQGTDVFELFLKKSGKKWDELPNNDFSSKEIDKKTVEYFKKLAVEKIPSISKEKNISELLKKLKLRSEDKHLNACVLLFAKDPQRYFSNAILKIGKFISECDIISNDIVKGNLFEQVEKAIEILRTKYLISNITYEGIHRREKLEYPEPALREAILNAIIHRRYATTSAVQIRVYDDKLIIMNEGKFPPEITAEKLKTKHLSKPGNILIAEMFYNAGYVETWGRGTLKILEQCQEAGLPEPDFNEDSGVITVTFYKNKLAALDISNLNLNERQIKAIEYLKEHGKITNSEYQKIDNTPRQTATRDLTDLVKKKIVKKIGKRGEGTYYILIDS